MKQIDQIDKRQTIAIFGEVLIDQFPDGKQVLGGAPFNVAWHLQAFGMTPTLISRIGNDASGENIKRAMVDWAISIENLQIDPIYPTGTVAVSINQGEPSYEILPNQAYDFIELEPSYLTKSLSIIYHGTLALRNSTSAQALQALKAVHTGKVFIDVNLRAPWWQKQAVEQWLFTADWIKLNHHELMEFVPLQNNLQAMMQVFLEQYNVELLIVTCGSAGATLLNNLGQFINIEPASDLSIKDTVGAGDAFSAIVLLGLQQGWQLSVMMARAQAFASAMVTQRGAIVQDLNFYKAFLEEWQIG
jgi:fructokinase